MNCSEEYNTADIMQSRQGLYMFLSRVFLRELDKAYLITLLERNAFSNNSDKKTEADFEKGRKLIEDCLELWMNDDIDATVGNLRKDFAHLFFVKNKGVVSPYESVYLGCDRLLMQEPYEQVLEFYNSVGVIRAGTSQEIEDHIAVECEFMGILCELCLDALNKNDEKKYHYWISCQQSFLYDHLGRWAPQLCEDMLGRTKSLFYEGIAYMTRGFIETEMNEGRRAWGYNKNEFQNDVCETNPCIF